MENTFKTNTEKVIDAHSPAALEVAAFIMNARGYIVLAVRSDAANDLFLGQIVYDLWSNPIPHPLRIVAKTDEQDWVDQCDLIYQNFKIKQARTKAPCPSKSCWRAMTD